MPLFIDDSDSDGDLEEEQQYIISSNPHENVDIDINYPHIDSFDNVESPVILNLETGELIPITRVPNSISPDNGVDKAIKEIMKFNLSEEIKTTAINILYKMDLRNITIKYQIKRNMCIFACIYYAHEELEQPIDPITLLNNLGMTDKKKDKSIHNFQKNAFSNFSEIQTGYCPPKKLTEPYQLIPELMIKLGMLSEAEVIQDYCIKIMKRNDEKVFHNRKNLREDPPQNVAAAILLHYLIINGREIDREEYPTIVGKKRATIDQIYRQIPELDI